MTTTNSDTELIKMDCIGRVRTTAEHRGVLLAAYEESALSGPEFCKHHGIKYQTFATWLQKRRRATGAYPSMESLKTMHRSCRFRWLRLNFLNHHKVHLADTQNLWKFVYPVVRRSISMH
ncbi:MAG: hypothetical protein HC845_10870 [Akkermansiaceae bacterium]|nr:hypothetical protein [Akkermansiaceae bacterium]